MSAVFDTLEPSVLRAVFRGQAQGQADRRARWRSGARAAGEAFPTPDGCIAAIAAAHDFAVASRDASAFTATGLTVIDPWTAA